MRSGVLPSTSGSRASCAAARLSCPWRGATGRERGAIARRHGRLDVLVNTVGQRNRKPLLEFAEAEMRALLDADLVAGLHLARAAAPMMLPRRSGRMIWVTSIAGQVARPNDAVYIA